MSIERNCDTCVFKRGKAYQCKSCIYYAPHRKDNWKMRPSLKKEQPK